MSPENQASAHYKQTAKHCSK